MISAAIGKAQDPASTIDPGITGKEERVNR